MWVRFWSSSLFLLANKTRRKKRTTQWLIFRCVALSKFTSMYSCTDGAIVFGAHGFVWTFIISGTSCASTCVYVYDVCVNTCVRTSLRFRSWKLIEPFNWIEPFCFCSVCEWFQFRIEKRELDDCVRRKVGKIDFDLHFSFQFGCFVRMLDYYYPIFRFDLILISSFSFCFSFLFFCLFSCSRLFTSTTFTTQK